MTPMKNLFLISLLAVLTGCIAPVSMQDTSECWRYGVSDSGNTGRMTDNDGLPHVVKLGYDELQAVCGKAPEGAYVRACYEPLTDTIYLYKLDIGDYYYNHELCHRELGRLHNACNGKGYANSTIDWCE